MIKKHMKLTFTLEAVLLSLNCSAQETATVTPDGPETLISE